MATTSPKTRDAQEAHWFIGMGPRGPFTTSRDLSGAYVRADGDLINIWVPDYKGADDGVVFQLARSEARLLAKRLGQCLDATVLR